jgi:hypothetical protein
MDHAKRFELTSPEPEWEPQSDHFKQEEEKAGLLLDGYQHIYDRNIFVFALSVTDYSPFQLYHQAQETIQIEDDSREDHQTLSA